jgi:hypothetical protein
MYQLKKEVKVTQMQAKRMTDEVMQRLNVTEGRLQVCENECVFVCLCVCV